jgi:predicted metal-dependent enzyme (double-stranded beta helix superfamily)
MTLDSDLSLDAFCCQTREALLGQPLDEALAATADALRRLLANPRFVAEAFGADDPPPKRLLHTDEATGFRVLAHVQPAGKGGAPHDHGDSWAVYGNARGRTEMTEYRRVNAAGESAAVLAQTLGYALQAGQARVYPPGAVHATAHPELAWVIRVTGTDLDAIPRYRFRKAVDTLLPSA